MNVELWECGSICKVCDWWTKVGVQISDKEFQLTEIQYIAQTWLGTLVNNDQVDNLQCYDIVTTKRKTRFKKEVLIVQVSFTWIGGDT